MPRGKLSISLPEVLLLLFLAHMLLPAVGYYTPSVVYMGITVLLYFVFFCSSGRELNSSVSYAIPFLLLIFIIYFQLLLNSVFSFALQMYGQLQVIFWPVFALYVIRHKRVALVKKTISWTFVFCVITVITTIVGVSRFPNAARILATNLDTNSYEYTTYLKNNIGGFSFVYAVVALFPMVICFWKQKRINTIIMAVLSILCVVFAFAAEYSTAILLILCSLVLLFMGQRLTKKQLIILLVVAGGVIVLGQGLLSSLFTMIANHTSSVAVRLRLTELAMAFSGGDISTSGGDVSHRMDLYMSSIYGFFRNPLWGGKGAGGHSYILDLLANHGIIGGLTLLWIYTRIYRYMYKPFWNQPFFGYMLYCYIICILMAIINTNPTWFAVSCIVPLCGYYLSETGGNV